MVFERCNKYISFLLLVKEINIFPFSCYKRQKMRSKCNTDHNKLVHRFNVGFVYFILIYTINIDFDLKSDYKPL